MQGSLLQLMKWIMGRMSKGEDETQQTGKQYMIPEPIVNQQISI